MIAHLLILAFWFGGIDAVHHHQVESLAEGIQVTAPWNIPPTLARRLAAEAMDVTQDPRYQWLEPVDLLALAAAESDFRPWRVTEGGKVDKNGWDCGLTGVRTPVFTGGKNRRGRKLCRDVVASTYLAMRYSARELTGYRRRCLKKRLGPWELRRCIWNSYNQGPKYVRIERCGKSKRCRHVARYWLRVHCYRMGILLARLPRLRRRGWKRRFRVSCRDAKSLRWIWRAY